MNRSVNVNKYPGFITSQIKNYSIEAMTAFISNSFDNLIKEQIVSSYKDRSQKEMKGNLSYIAGNISGSYGKPERRALKRELFLSAIKGCPYSKQDKDLIKEYISDKLLYEYCLNEDTVNQAIPFNQNSRLSPQDRFEIILSKRESCFGSLALQSLIRDYRLDNLKRCENMEYFCITADEIDEIYNYENPVLSYNEKFSVVVQRVYSLYKGYNCIDVLLDMNLDGISCGVNGYPESFAYNYSKENVPRSYDSIWIMNAGKSIHLKFLSLGSYTELERICQAIYRYDSPGQLSRKDGFIVNRLKDGSRVVVLRPEFCETWVLFVRKFDVPDISLSALIGAGNIKNLKRREISVSAGNLSVIDNPGHYTYVTGSGINPGNPLVTEDGREELAKLISFLVKGCRNISVTGAQGTGKTTLLNSMIDHIYHFYPLRILEMAFELHVRKRFPNRNIVTFQETEYISGQDGLDISKKTDGAVTIVGEVASDPVASYMIHIAMVASRFILFSHHAKTFPDLVQSLRNSLLGKSGSFTSEKVAEEQVVNILNFDIHVEKNDITGERYIERITECIPATAESSLNNSYYWKNILEYDEEKDKYVVKNPISHLNYINMKRSLTDIDAEDFEIFCNKLGLRK